MLKKVGVLSILEGNLLDDVTHFWKHFETKYGTKCFQSFDQPHLSFLGGYCREIAPVQNALAELCQTLNPFELRIDGFGYFDSPSKVIFLKVLPTEELRKMHRLLHDAFKQHCERVIEFYYPDKWTPHITVAMESLTDEDIQRARRDLSGLYPQYRQMISNVALIEIYDEAGRIESVRTWKLESGQ